MWRFLKKLQIELPYDPAIPLLGIYPEKTRIERDTWTPMFIAALFIIVRTWKQPRCPSADEWILLPFLRGYLLSFSSISLITKRKKKKVFTHQQPSPSPTGESNSKSFISRFIHFHSFVREASERRHQRHLQ